MRGRAGQGEVAERGRDTDIGVRQNTAPVNGWRSKRGRTTSSWQLTRVRADITGFRPVRQHSGIVIAVPFDQGCSTHVVVTPSTSIPVSASGYDAVGFHFNYLPSIRVALCPGALRCVASRCVQRDVLSRDVLLFN